MSTGDRTGDSTGARFVAAIAARDLGALEALLAPDVSFRGVTPGRAWEGASAPEVLEAVFDHWFAESDHIVEVAHLEEGDPVVDTRRVGYRFTVRNPDGLFAVEQQAYYREVGDRIGYLRVVCSGYRPLPGG